MTDEPRKTSRGDLYNLDCPHGCKGGFDGLWDVYEYSLDCILECTECGRPSVVEEIDRHITVKAYALADGQ